MRRARSEKKRTSQKCLHRKNETVIICCDPEIVNAPYSTDVIERVKVRRYFFSSEADQLQRKACMLNRASSMNTRSPFRIARTEKRCSKIVYRSVS